jgi:ELWxxDGT repeat protein
MPFSHADEAPVHLVADLLDEADAAAGIAPAPPVVVGDKIFFVGWDALAGDEPWVSDGTPEGTRRIADTCPGPCGIFGLVPLGEAVYFESCDGVSVCQLWRSDGTAEGTAPITDFSRRGGRVRYLTAWNGALYFSAADAAHGEELFRSDGTAEGTELAVDLVPGPGDAGISDLAAVGDRLFFAADATSEIWASDGTPSGTVRVRPQIPHQFLSSPIVAAGSRAFWVEASFDLWTSDGTPSGTRRVFPSDRVVQLLATFDGDVYFRQLSQDFDANELWISDGTVAGTHLVRGDFERLSAPSFGVEYLGELYFASHDELWKTDGTTPGTTRVAVLDDRIRSLGAPLPGELLIGTGVGLWRLEADGDLLPLGDGFSPLFFTAFQDAVLFRASNETVGTELAVFEDGELTFLSDSVDPGSSHPAELTRRGDSLVFTDSRVPPGVYETDGTGAQLLATVEGPGGFSSGTELVTAGSHTFVLGEDLWVAGAGGLARIFESFPEGAQASRSLFADSAVSFGSHLVFLVWNQETSFIEVWASDGTRAGTRKLDDLTEFFYCGVCSPPQPPPVYDIVVGRNRLAVFFEGRLWITDVATGGAIEVDLTDGCDHCLVGPAAIVGERLFFATAGPSFFASTEPRRLWVSDGTDAGTFVLREFDAPRPGGRVASIDELVGAGDRLFFTAETPQLGDELWVSDGTVAGTAPVVDLRPGGESSNPRGLTLLGGEIYFAADDGVHGRELWAADGTVFGTRRVADLRPGPASSSPGELAAIDGRLHFAADDGVAGLEPWTSDGSAAGTVLLRDLQPGPLPSSPSSFVAAGSQVYFTAATADTGFELWTTPRIPCQRCLLDGRFLVTARWFESGIATAAVPVAFSDETATFWFFDRSNTELVVKVLDGRRQNGHFWVFYGALSNLEYEIRVEDRTTGVVRTYHNRRDNLCGGADVLAFRGFGSGGAGPLPAGAEAAKAGGKGAGPCPDDPGTLCLRGGRYGVEVEWTDQHHGGAVGSGRAIPDTDESGFFWFFDRDNLELAVKLLDGSGTNGKMWFFYGALSDVEYEITVTDWQTGASTTYHNAPGELCGGADIEALDP